MQVPPMYSAIKINGKKLYEYARNGETVEVPARKIEIYKLDFINFNENNQILEIEVSCSKGTYIRVLCEDIAKKLGTVGFMLELNRVKVDKFGIEDSLNFNELERNKKNIEKYLIKMEEIFKELPQIYLTERKKELFLNGVVLRDFENFEDGVYNIFQNKYIGIGIVKNGTLKRDIII